MISEQSDAIPQARAANRALVPSTRLAATSVDQGQAAQAARRGGPAQAPPAARHGPLAGGPGRTTGSQCVAGSVVFYSVLASDRLFGDSESAGRCLVTPRRPRSDSDSESLASHWHHDRGRVSGSEGWSEPEERRSVRMTDPALGDDRLPPGSYDGSHRHSLACLRGCPR